jgi:hypothetical protein
MGKMKRSGLVEVRGLASALTAMMPNQGQKEVG